MYNNQGFYLATTFIKQNLGKNVKKYTMCNLLQPLMNDEGMFPLKNIQMTLH